MRAGFGCAKCDFKYIPSFTNEYIITTAEDHAKNTGHTIFILALDMEGEKAE